MFVEVEDEIGKIPGEDDESDMSFAQADTFRPKKHGGLFGCDINNVKYWLAVQFHLLSKIDQVICIFVLN